MEKIEDQAPKEHKKNWREVYSSVDEMDIPAAQRNNAARGVSTGIEFYTGLHALLASD